MGLASASAHWLGKQCLRLPGVAEVERVIVPGFKHSDGQERGTESGGHLSTGRHREKMGVRSATAFLTKSAAQELRRTFNQNIRAGDGSVYT